MKTKKDHANFMKNLGFPSQSEDIIEGDGSINESKILELLFAEIKNKKVEIDLRSECFETLPKNLSVTGTADCVAHIFGSHLELTDVSESETLLRNQELHYHPKNSGKSHFGYCCAGFAKRHDPAKDDLLVISIKSILCVKYEGKEIFKYESYEDDDRFCLFLNGESMFKGYEDRF